MLFHWSSFMRTQRVVVIGAGIGGLTAALLIAARGLAVTVVEKAVAPGGKISEVCVEGARIDSGPTVFTMRWAFEEIVAEAGESFSGLVRLNSADVLARHAWSDAERLDLFADAARSTDAIGDLAGRREAEGYVRFCRRSQEIYETLRDTFITSPKPSVFGLVRRAGIAKLPGLARISPFATLWRSLGSYFHDPRLLQLFGRYATYCGSSPFLAPATLMLVAHVERQGVWLVEGGMHRLALAFSNLAISKGAQFRYGSHAARIIVADGRAKGVELTDGERLQADAVIMNGDANALADGMLGEDVSWAAPGTTRAARSLSAATWAIYTSARGFPLLRHNVFFSRAYRGEFEDILALGRLPREPTVYVCAQDRPAIDCEPPSGRERLLCLVNAPPNGDSSPTKAEELRSCEEAMRKRLAGCGLQLDWRAERVVRTTPPEFDLRFPGTGGALYGPASHGWMASFARPAARTRIPGLYLAGGSVHPGPGVPMAALSGRQAAWSAMADLALTARSYPAAMSGGTSMRSAKTARLG
jgi:1-hydroxycarotenoid 3,4-desaturase